MKGIPDNNGLAERPHDRNERLLHILGELRGAAASHLGKLLFRDGDRTTKVSDRAVYARVERLVDGGFLTRALLPDSRQTILHLTEKGRTAFPSVAAAFTDQVRKPPTDDVACWAWQRAALWASLRGDGFNVGNGLPALLALRRSLIDRHRQRSPGGQPRRDASLEALRRAPELTPHFYWRCSQCPWSGPLDAPAVAPCPACAGALKQELVAQPWRCRLCGLVTRSFAGEHRAPSSTTTLCPGRLKPHRYLPFDVAHLQVPGQPPEVRLLLVDNPMRSIESQLLDLPLRFLEQPKLDVIIRPSDDGSIFDADAGRWAMKGRRLRALEAAFQPHDNPRLYPFWVSANVITYRPDVVLRSVRSRRSHAS